MARNRNKHQSGAIRLVPALKAFFLCLLLGGTAVGYVIQKNKIHELGQQIALLEERLAQLKMVNRIRASQLQDMQRPNRLAERVRELNLGLMPPQPGQVIWLREPPASAPTNTTAPMFAEKK